VVVTSVTPRIPVTQPKARLADRPSAQRRSVSRGCAAPGAPGADDHVQIVVEEGRPLAAVIEQQHVQLEATRPQSVGGHRQVPDHGDDPVAGPVGRAAR
jgi:hypothetical protein